MVAKIAANLRLSADGFAVRTSLVAGGHAVAIARQLRHGTDRRTDGQTEGSRYRLMPPPTVGRGHNNVIKNEPISTILIHRIPTKFDASGFAREKVTALPREMHVYHMVED